MDVSPSTPPAPVAPPSGVCCASASPSAKPKPTSPHGGQESTLLSMMLPLLHHGMYLVGIPFTERALSTTRTGGSPYGASHVSGHDAGAQLSDDEKQLAQVLGRRVAELALRISAR